MCKSCSDLITRYRIKPYEIQPNLHCRWKIVSEVWLNASIANAMWLRLFCIMHLLLMPWSYVSFALTHWGRMTNICVSKLTSIGSDNGLSPGRRQVIIWTNAWILLVRPPGTIFNEILIEIHIFSFKKSIWKCRLHNGGHFVSAPKC